MSSSQNERTLGVEGLGRFSKTNKDEQGERGDQNSGILSKRTFWMSPKNIPNKIFYQTNTFLQTEVKVEL